jgi:uncharacterized oxidoreductase
MKTGNNTVLITGGTSGIGLALAEALMRSGNTVLICGRRKDRLEALEARHPRLITKTCDVASASERAALYEWAVDAFPDLNILVNNAGVQLLTDLTQETDLSRVMSEIDINLVAPIHLSSLFAPHLAGQKNAAIVNISSGLAFCPIAHMAVYCATKAALHSFTLSLRHQLKDTPVKVFEIIPPSVDTELGHDRRADKTQTHGGMPVAEFIEGAMEALREDIFEAPIGPAQGLRAKREELFGAMNKGFEERYRR